MFFFSSVPGLAPYATGADPAAVTRLSSSDSMGKLPAPMSTLWFCEFYPTGKMEVGRGREFKLDGPQVEERMAQIVPPLSETWGVRVFVEYFIFKIVFHSQISTGQYNQTKGRRENDTAVVSVWHC